MTLLQARNSIALCIVIRFNLSNFGILLFKIIEEFLVLIQERGFPLHARFKNILHF